MDERVERHAELFASLGSETRLSILVALDDALDDEPVTYADLMAETDLEDSGQFNYHLQQMLGQFVQKQGDHYVPTPAGVMLLRAITSGQYDREWDRIGAVPLGVPCERCGTERVIAHEGLSALKCPNCEDGIGWDTMVPQAFERRSDAEIRAAIDTSIKATHRDMLAGVCPWCGGTTSVWCSVETDLPLRIRSREQLVYYQCDVCRALSFSSIGQYLQIHPTVVEYCQEHEIDFPERPLWAVPSAVTDRTTHVRSREPWAIEKYVTADGCRLVAVIEATDGDADLDSEDAIRHIDHLPIGP